MHVIRINMGTYGSYEASLGKTKQTFDDKFTPS